MISTIGLAAITFVAILAWLSSEKQSRTFWTYIQNANKIRKNYQEICYKLRARLREMRGELDDKRFALEMKNAELRDANDYLARTQVILEHVRDDRNRLDCDLTNTQRLRDITAHNHEVQIDAFKSEVERLQRALSTSEEAIRELTLREEESEACGAELEKILGLPESTNTEILEYVRRLIIDKDAFTQALHVSRIDLNNTRKKLEDVRKDRDAAEASISVLTKKEKKTKAQQAPYLLANKHLGRGGKH